MIAQARAAPSERHPDEVPTLAIQLGLRRIGPSGVGEALGILTSAAETDDVLVGLLRGLALIHESTDPLIGSTLCDYATSPSLGLELRMEARESLRIRCLEGRVDLGFDPDARACLAGLSGPP